MTAQFSQHHLLKRLYLFRWVFLVLLTSISWLHSLGFVYELSILLHWSICLLLCQYHSVLLYLYYIAWNQEVWHLPLCSSFSVLFWCLLWFHINFMSVFSTLALYVIVILIGIAVNLDSFKKYEDFSYINSSNPWTQDTILLVSSSSSFISVF